MDTEYINTIIKNINKFIRSILKLSLLHKIFIILLVLLFICIFNSNYNYQYIENFINEEKFVQKYDNDVYDKQYSQHYDRIFLNKKRNNFEFENIKPYIKDNIYLLGQDIHRMKGNLSDMEFKRLCALITDKDRNIDNEPIKNI